MKKTHKTISFLIMALSILFLSCSKDSIEEVNQGFGKLSISYNDISKLKANYDVKALIISIETIYNEPIMTNKRIDLYNFGDQYYSEEIEFETGEYLLTSFMVVDSKNEIVYVAPQWDSEQAEFVYEPLPIYFKIQKDVYKTIAPEVIDINNCNCSAQSFGYAAFSFNVVDVCPEKEDSILPYQESLIHIEAFSALLPDTLHLFFLPNGALKMHIGSIMDALNADNMSYHKETLLAYIDQAMEVGEIENTAIIEKIAMLSQEISTFNFESNNSDPCFKSISIKKDIIYQGINFGYMDVLNIATSFCGQDNQYNNDQYALQVSQMIDELIGENINFEEFFTYIDVPFLTKL